MKTEAIHDVLNGMSEFLTTLNKMVEPFRLKSDGEWEPNTPRRVFSPIHLARCSGPKRELFVCLLDSWWDDEDDWCHAPLTKLERLGEIIAYYPKRVAHWAEIMDDPMIALSVAAKSNSRHVYADAISFFMFAHLQSKVRVRDFDLGGAVAEITHEGVWTPQGPNFPRVDVKELTALKRMNLASFRTEVVMPRGYDGVEPIEWFHHPQIRVHFGLNDDDDMLWRVGFGGEGIGTGMRKVLRAVDHDVGERALSMTIEMQSVTAL